MKVKATKAIRSAKEFTYVRVTDRWSGNTSSCHAELTAHRFQNGQVHGVMTVKTPFGLKHQKFYFSRDRWDGLGNYRDSECNWQLPAEIRDSLRELAQ